MPKKNEMKILVVTPTFLPIIGGVELGIYEIYQRLGKHHKVRILTPNRAEDIISSQGVTDTYFNNMNFEVYRFNDTLNLNAFRGQRFFKKIIPPFSFSCIWSVLKHINSFHPDVINFYYIITSGLALILVRMLTNIPVILSLVSRMDVLENEISFRRRYYSWMVVKSASCVIPISKYCLRWPLKYRLEKIIPYGVDTKQFSSKVNGQRIREKLGIGRDKMVLFALQRLVGVKRVDILIKSLPYILQANKEVVLVIGGKGPEESSLKVLARRLNVSSDVIFSGYIPEEELPAYFAMADIFTFSSHNETFGIVLVQAMASGKPIVAVNITAIPEIIDNGVNGILVEPFSAKKFAAGVIKLLNDKNLRKRYSEAGRKKAIERYDWDIIAQEYEGVFRDLVRSKGCR